jgi:integrase
VNAATLGQFHTDMRLAALSPATISARLDTVGRLAAWLEPASLLAARAEQLAEYERRFAGLAPASVDVYVRHVQAFYRWAAARRLVDDDPSRAMIRPQLRRGRPHPTSVDELRVIFGCARGPLRIAYTLAAFAGLRCGEICRLRHEHLSVTDGCAVADVLGKGGRARVVPLLEPVVAEVGPGRGWVITRHGAGYRPQQLSLDSHVFLRSIGVATTLHSMRHAFATATYRSTRDLLLVQRLLGHESVATTQIYAEPDTADAYRRLAPVAASAGAILRRPRLAAAS